MSEEWNALSNEKKKPYIKKQKLIKKDMKMRNLFMIRKKKMKNLLRKNIKKIIKMIKKILMIMRNKLNF
jgi:predicted ferric reductase